MRRISNVLSIKHETVKRRDASSSRRAEYADRSVHQVRDLGARRHNAEMRCIYAFYWSKMRSTAAIASSKSSLTIQ